MKDVLSKETAKSLKAAGFPVPDLCQGQMWHDGERYYTISSVSKSKVRITGITFSEHTENGEELDFHKSLMRNDVFLPTTIDILRELPDDEWSLEYYKKHDVWNVHMHIRYDGDRHLPHSYPHALIDPAKQGYKNPAEAAAAFWLSLKLKK